MDHEKETAKIPKEGTEDSQSRSARRRAIAADSNRSAAVSDQNLGAGPLSVSGASAADGADFDPAPLAAPSEGVPQIRPGSEDLLDIRSTGSVLPAQNLDTDAPTRRIGLVTDFPTEESLIDPIGTPVALVEAATGIIIALNREFAEQSAFKRNDLRGREIWTAFPRLIGKSWTRMADSSKREAGFSVASLLVRKTGSMVPVTLRGAEWGGVGSGIVCVTVFDETHGEATTERMRHQLAVSSAVSEVSRFLMTADGSNLDKVVQIMAGAVKAHRGQIYRWDDELLTTLDGQSEWAAEGAKPVTEEGGPDDVSRLSWWFQKLNEGGSFQISDVQELPTEANYLRELYEQAGTRATLVGPIVSTRGRLIGVLGLVDIDLPRKWSREDLAAVQTVAEMLAVFWERKEAEDSIRRSFRLESCLTRAGAELARPAGPDYRAFLAVIGKALEMDRVSMEFDGGPDAREGLKVNWLREGGESLAGVVQALLKSPTPWLAEKLSSQKPLVVGNVDWLPTEAKWEKELLKSVGARSFALVELRGSDGVATGHLAMTTSPMPRQWRPDEASALGTLASLVSTHWTRMVAERSLSRRMGIQQMLAQAAQLLLRAEENGVAKIAEQAALAFGAHSGSILVIGDGEPEIAEAWSEKHYPAPGRRPLDSVTSCTGLAWWDEMLAAGRAFAINDVDTLPRAAAEVRQCFAAAGTKSAIIAPVLDVSGKAAGVITLADLKQARRWEAADLESLEVLSSLVAAHWQALASRRSLRQQAEILTHTRDGLFVMLASGVIRSWNPGAEAIFGLTASEAIDRNLFELVPTSRPRELANSIAREMQTSGRAEREFSLVLANGSKRLVAFRFMTSGRVAQTPDAQQFIVHASDMTEQSELRSRLAESQRMETLGVLARSVAHDINNILAPILAYTQMVRDNADEGTRDHERLGKVLTAVRRARSLSAEILGFSKLREPVRATVTPAEIVESALRRIEQTKPAEVRIEVDVARDLPLLNADVEQMQQAIVNLCSSAWQAICAHGNAAHETVGASAPVSVGAQRRHGDRVDFSSVAKIGMDSFPTAAVPVGHTSADSTDLQARSLARSAGGGTIRIEAAATRVTNASDAPMVGMSVGTWVRFTVADDGPGIPEDAQSKVFEPFYTAKATGVGASLGLAAAGEIVRAHGGVTLARSDPSGGARLDIYLPSTE